MQENVFQILFLGEDLAWSKIATPLTDGARADLKIHRAQSLNELFLVLAGGEWHAAAIDIQAWNFQGLHYVEKIRSEYPAFPIFALQPVSNDLALKAKTSGASRCISLEELSLDSIHSAMLSCLSEKKSRTHLRKVSPMTLTFNLPDSSSGSSSKTQIISHALNNLLCVITSNADILADHVDTSGPAIRSLAEIKKAAKSASDLTRLLK